MVNINIDEYLQRGFGSMNKNDFEVLILEQLIQENYFGSQNPTDFEISTTLGIAQSKVKRLRYEAELKKLRKTNPVVNTTRHNANQEEMFKQKAKQLLENIKIRKDGSREKVILATEDKLLQNYIDSVLKKHNSFSDSSFNREVIILYAEDLAVLLEELYGTAYVEEVLKHVKSPEKDYSWSDVVEEGLKVALGDAKANAVCVTIDKLRSHFKSIKS